LPFLLRTPLLFYVSSPFAAKSLGNFCLFTSTCVALLFGPTDNRRYIPRQSLLSSFAYLEHGVTNPRYADPTILLSLVPAAASPVVRLAKRMHSEYFPPTVRAAGSTDFSQILASSVCSTPVNYSTFYFPPYCFFDLSFLRVRSFSHRRFMTFYRCSAPFPFRALSFFTLRFFPRLPAPCARKEGALPCLPLIVSLTCRYLAPFRRSQEMDQTVLLFPLQVPFLCFLRYDRL